MRLFYRLIFLSIFFFLISGTHSQASGWSSKKKKKKKIEKIIGTAKGYIGTKYKFGGTTRSGMDCSGLMITAYKAIDVELPRTSADQSKAGKGVSVTNLRPGDLVFFALGKKKRRVTHVGMVTEIKNKDKVLFIHSSSKRGVVQANLMSDYYIKHLVRCRRII